MPTYWSLYLASKQQQLCGPVNYRDFRETDPRSVRGPLQREIWHSCSQSFDPFGQRPWRWPKESKLWERELKFEEANSWNLCINFRLWTIRTSNVASFRNERLKNGKERKKNLECIFTHLGFFTSSAVTKSLACCEMGSKCFELNSYLTSVIVRHVSSTVSPWKGDTPLRLQRKNKNCDKYLFNQCTRICQTGNVSWKQKVEMVNKALLLLYQHLHDISNNSNAPVTKETENRQNKQNYVKNYALICGGRQKGGGGGEKR